VDAFPQDAFVLRDLTVIVLAGEKISAEKASALGNTVANHPDDLVSRAKLLGYITS